MDSLFEEIPWASAVYRGKELACPWCFTSSLSAWGWCHPSPGPSLPQRAWLYRGNPGFHFLLRRLSRSSPSRPCREGSQPRATPPAPAPCPLRRHRAASPHPMPSSALPILERDLPRAADWTPPALTLPIPTASGRGFFPFSFPLSPALRTRGRLLYRLSGMTRRRAGFRDRQQRISTQVCLVKGTF